MKASVSSESFLSNFKELKASMRDSLPTDVLLLQCDNCQTNLPLNSDGIVKVERPLEEDIGNVIDAMLKGMVDSHIQKYEQCNHENMNTHPVLGTPTNICVSFPASNNKFVRDFRLKGNCYKVNVTVVNLDYKAIFVLYQQESCNQNTYSEFINCNFNTFLDLEVQGTDEVFEEEWIYDDESVSSFQQMLPRIIGGGRKIRADYNYVCLWCPKEDLKKGTRGRYRELKNYRDHFKKYHHGEDGKGIPMSEFIKKLNRCEPTWFCRNCKQHYSLGNQVRHKAICQLESSESDSDSEEAVPNEKRKQTQTRSAQPEKIPLIPSSVALKENTGNMINHHPSRSTSASTTGTCSIEEDVNKQREKTPTVHISSKQVPKSGHYMTNQQPSASTSRTCLVAEDLSDKERGCSGSGHNEVESMQEDIPQFHSKRTIIDESGSSPHEKNNNEICQQQKRVKNVELFDVSDEVYISEDEQEASEKELEIKVELLESENPTFQKEDNINKWWLKIPKHLYTDRNSGGPKIFLPTDSEEFVKNVSINYKMHMSKKKDLDEKMIRVEASDEKFQQFSIERDQPFVDKYKEYVQSLSAKNVLHMFSEEYEELDIPSTGKSSTALQYSYRIIEFFKFMANIYPNFHLDWMIDFQCKIEKVHPDGKVCDEIFLPTKNNVTDFIKQFKYGSNPAANCGVRIFALKKLMDFLVQEMKDNEHAFSGNIIENSTKVECLVQKLKNLNSSICPEGTIKHLATAANKSHKRTLVEKLAKCPQRTMSSIMDGVSEYVASEDCLIEQTKLIELACKRTKVPTAKEYMNTTNWLLEQLICIGGNRPCALLGITIRDWEERKPGYCPFNQDEENDMIEEDPEHDKRKVLQNPYKKPKGSSEERPTGVIVRSETDKIAIGPPCYIWFPNFLVDLVNYHSLIAQKILPRSVDIYHPKTRLFLNSNGNPIKSIDCKHFKNYIGLPITAYDFRRSLSTFCLDSKIDAVRNSESAVLRHREQTGFAYYYQKHSEKVEYVSIQYAMSHGLIKAKSDSVDEYCDSLRKDAANDEWELTQKRTDKALEYSQNMMQKRKQSLNDARKKGGRNWILPAEYDSFIEGIEEAMKMEETKMKNGLKPGPFSQLLKYKPGAKDAGTFPPAGIWFLDMYRVLFGLSGNKGDEMRQVELSVYDGVPFSTGLSGRKKIEALKKKYGSTKQDADMIVASYWREKIKDESKQIVKAKWLPLRFIFTEKDFEYYIEQTKGNIKAEDE